MLKFCTNGKRTTLIIVRCQLIFFLGCVSLLFCQTILCANHYMYSKQLSINYLLHRTTLNVNEEQAFNNNIHGSVASSKEETTKNNSNFLMHENNNILLVLKRRELHTSSQDASSDDQQQHDHNNTDTIWHKVSASVFVFLVGLFGCGLPWIINRNKLNKNTLENSLVAMCIRSLVCGTFLGFVLFHLMPETFELQHSILSKSTKSTDKLTPHLLEALISSFVFLGFILMLLFDKVLSGHEDDKEIKNLLSSSSSLVLENRADDDLIIEIISKKDNKLIKEIPKNRSDLETQNIHELLQSETTINCECPIHCSTSSNSSNIHFENHETGGAVTPCVSNELHNRNTPLKTTSKTSNYAVFSMLLLPNLCLIIHCVYEGFIVGSVQSPASVWIIVLAIAGHKWAVGLGLAVHLLEKQFNFTTIILVLGAFTISSPLGILTGMLAVNLNEWLEMIITAFGAGGILYMGCDLIFQQFSDKKGKQTGGFYQFCFMFLGALLIFVFTTVHMLTHEL